MMMTKIYFADLKCLKDERLFNAFYGSLSEYRRKKIDGIKRDSYKIQSLGAGMLLKKALYDTGIDESGQQYILNEYNKPYILKENIHFNLSHSGERAMCIISDRPVGCDIEKTRKVNYNIINRYFNKEEKEMLDAVSDEKKNDLFFEIWTLKESFVKAAGRGMKLPFDGFSVTGGELTYLNTKYYLYNAAADSGYKSAYCISEKKEEAEVLKVDLNELF